MYSRVSSVIISTIMKQALSSLICTVLNEEKNIEKFIDSIASQTVKPTEIIIVDGGSLDSTVNLIIHKQKEYKNKLNLNVLIKKGNRSVGRNIGIKNAKSKIIILTDAGCILDKNWVNNIVKPFENKSTDVVAGYYKGKPKNIFEKCLIPFVLVMEDKLKPKEFLPATRSMAIKKSVWRKIGGFNEKLSNNEDYAFANKLKDSGYNIKFEKSAIVYWLPRSSFKSTFRMFYRFAYGDIEAKILRVNVLLTILRYIIGIYLLILIPIMKSVYLNSFIIVLLVSYLIWSINKNYKYVRNPKALFYLPLLQFTADLAVVSGSFFAFLKIFPGIVLNFLKQNKLLVILIIGYVLTMLSIIDWGIPNPVHPFNYFMDEWHQSQSIRNLFTKGSPNIAGSANGSIFQFFLSGIYLIPFIITGLVHIFAIKSSVLNLPEQQKLFEILRLNTLIFGVLSISVFYYICKKYFKLNPLLATFLFIANPVWIMLSNYFKYDIALMFWILMSVLFLIRYAKKSNLLDFLLVGIFSSLALSTKLSVEPLFGVYILTYFIFTKNLKQNIKWLFAGLFLYVTIFLVFGIPDIVLGKGSLYEYLNSTLLRTPTEAVASLRLSSGLWTYLVSNLYPSLFGFTFYLGFIISFFLLIAIKIKEYLTKRDIKSYIQNNYALIVLFITFLMFAISLYPLKIGASNNRVLVLIPFMAIIFAWGFNRLKKIKNLSTFILFLFLILQLFQTYSWVYLKIKPDPRQTSAHWILNNIPKGTIIGIENIPIYQSLPDIVEKEFYLKLYRVEENYNFKYTIINKDLVNFPKFVIITNGELESKYIKSSKKTEIIKRLKTLNYKKIAEFKPNFKFLNLFTNDLNYYMSAIIQAPTTIEIYEKR